MGLEHVPPLILRMLSKRRPIQPHSNIWEQLRCNNQLCDGTVKCKDGVTFNIHRIILSGVSEYFRALFTNSINNGCPEINEAYVDFPGQVFQVILDYAYTSKCVVDVNNVFAVLKCADQYQVVDVLDSCYDFYIGSLNVSNCLQIMEFSSCNGCTRVAEHCHQFILRHFMKILEGNKDFLLVSASYLTSLLQDDCLVVQEEDTVLLAIKQWLSHDVVRTPHIPQLMRCVRLGQIQARPRIPYHVLFAIGGWSSGNPTRFMETYDNRAEKWLISKDHDDVARAYYGICTLDQKIYLIGGFDGYEYFNTVRCFDPELHQWVDCGAMHYQRCYVSVVACQNKVYAMGGYNGRTRLNSVEMYEPFRNQWAMVSSMMKQRSDAGAAVLDNKIYIAGGFNGHEVMNSVEMYDPDTDQWTFVNFMLSSRSGVSLMSHHNALYAIGGFNGYTRLASVEKLTKSSHWHEVAELNVPRSNFGSVILEGKIYIIGGFNGSCTINYVEYYDGEEDRWIDAPSMNINRSAIGACVVAGLSNTKDYSYLYYNHGWGV